MKREIEVLEILNSDGDVYLVLNLTDDKDDIIDYLSKEYPNIKILRQDLVEEVRIKDYLNYSGTVIENPIVYDEYWDNYFKDAEQLIFRKLSLIYNNEYFYNKFDFFYYAYKSIYGKFYQFDVSDENLIVREVDFGTLDNFILKDESNQDDNKIKFHEKIKKFRI